MFKKGVIYIVLNYMIQFLNIIFNLLLMKYLSSYQLGSLALAKTWQQFVDYSHLGARFSLDRYIPVAEKEEKKYLVVTVLFSTTVGAIIVFIVAVIFNDADIIVSLLTASGVFIAVSNILKAYYRAINNLNEMLKLVFFNQLVPLIIAISVYFVTLNFNFYLITLLLSYFLFASLLFYKERFLLQFLKFDHVKRVLKDIFTPSIWLFLNSILVFLYLIMDRFFIDYSLGREQLGLYSVIIFVFSALMVIPASIAELLFVKIIRQSCEAGKRFFLKETLITLVVTILGIIIANLCMGYFVDKFTNYSFLIKQMNFATLAVIPFALTSIYYHVMNGFDLRAEILIVNFLTLLGLFFYYFYPILINQNFSLDYYLYGKIITGWIVFIGYMIFLLTVNIKVKIT